MVSSAGGSSKQREKLWRGGPERKGYEYATQLRVSIMAARGRGAQVGGGGGGVHMSRMAVVRPFFTDKAYIACTKRGRLAGGVGRADATFQGNKSEVADFVAVVPVKLLSRTCAAAPNFSSVV